MKILRKPVTSRQNNEILSQLLLILHRSSCNKQVSTSHSLQETQAILQIIESQMSKGNEEITSISIEDNTRGIQRKRRDSSIKNKNKILPLNHLVPAKLKSSHNKQSDSIATKLMYFKSPWYRRMYYNHDSSSSFHCIGRKFRNDSHRRWSVATHKIKNILAVNDALNVSKNRTRERTMSIEQKSHFLDKFSTTRDRRFSGPSYELRRRPEPNHVADGVSNSSIELKDLLNDIKDSKSNISNCIDDIHERKSRNFFQILFEPYSTFIYIWSWIVILAIHYNTWVIILRIAFPVAQLNHKEMWFALDYTADLIYIIDVLVSSRMSFLENGIYVENVKRVSIKYFKSTLFILDLLSLLPLDLLFLYFPVNPTLRIPRLIKIFKVFQGKKLVESMTNFPNLVRGVFWLHVMFLLIHWNSCFFYIISKYEGFGSNKWVYPNIVEGHHRELIHRYMKCMYWSTLVLTTIGEDGTPETTIE